MSGQIQPQTRRDIEAQIIAKAWKDEAYKQKLLSNPKAVLEQEFNIQFPAEIKVEVKEENRTSLYFILPIRPEIAGQEISDKQLAAIAGGASGALITDIVKDGAKTIVSASLAVVSLQVTK